MDWELWGTFSVGDHLRRRAYVADVLLYDQLVIPTPPDSDREEEQRWREMGWRPDHQRHLLELIGPSRVKRVPWTPQLRQNWEGRYHEALGAQRAGAERAAVRSEMAAAAAADVSRALDARKQFEKSGGHPEEVDQLAQVTSRELLRDWSNMQDDTKLFMGLPPTQVDAVAAYGSYSAFRRDHQVDLTEGQSPAPAHLLNLFSWEFLVPNDSKRSDEDLLRQALDLADLQETKQHRQIFHRWRGEVIRAGKAPDEILKEMEEIIQQYRAAIRRSKIATGASYAFAVETAALGAAAVAVPPVGIPVALAGLGAFLASEVAHREIPAELKIAAMFHDARKRFGWYRWMRRRR